MIKSMCSLSKQQVTDLPRSTSLNGLPLANMMLSPTMENASSGVHSAANESKGNL